MGRQNIRKPCVSGTFYPSSRDDLVSFLRKLDMQQNIQPEPPVTPVAVLVPHAGYIYSGRTAMVAYRQLRNSTSRTFVIAGPDHYGTTNMVSIQSSGKWETPLGNAKINQNTALEILRSSDNVVEYEPAHRMEHSIEVQLPFLQYLFGEEFTFVPLSLGSQTMESMMILFRSLASLNEPFTLIASSDLDHYESDSAVREKDMELIGTVINLEIERFYETVLTRDISACGYGSIALLMMYAKSLGLKIKLLDHTTSAEASGDFSRVVGYASMLASR